MCSWDAAWDDKLGSLVEKAGKLLEEAMYQFPLEDDMARQCLRPLSSQTKAVRECEASTNHVSCCLLSVLTLVPEGMQAEESLVTKTVILFLFSQTAFK